MIQYLKVEGLNNQFDHEFEFNEDLNIFTGPNGSGKTTLLKLIWHLISDHLQLIIYEIPFNSIIIRTDSFILTVTHVKSNRVKFDCKFNQQKDTSSKHVVVTVDPETNDYKERVNIEKLDEMSKQIASAMKSSLFFPTFRRIESEFSNFSKINFPTYNLMSDLPNPQRAPEILQEALSGLSTALSVGKHKFITSISTHDIVRFLTQKYVDISGEIDNLHTTSTNNIIEKIQTYSDGDKESKNRETQDAATVLDNIQNIVEQITTTRKDLLKPFSVLANLAQDILKYHSISIAEKIKSNKEVEGITIGKGTDGITFGRAKDVDMSSGKLSSGEKQMLSFLCYNAFSKDTAIFIDEPELSLHIDWQSLLVPTLLEQATKNQFFVATHSPFIYTPYPDKEFQLRNIRR